MRQGWFIPYSVHDGKTNMDADERILEYSIENSLPFPVFRLYGWTPSCVSLGRNQNDGCADKEFCEKENIDIVKRLTGGRALFHDDEITYSFVCPVSFLQNGETIISSYREISGALSLGFAKLGLKVDFPKEESSQKINHRTVRPEYCMSVSSGADLSFSGKKIVGSAQFRKKGYILQHGSIMFDYDKQKIERIFHEAPMEDKIVALHSVFPLIEREKIFSELKRTLPCAIEEFFSINLVQKDIKDFL